MLDMFQIAAMLLTCFVGYCVYWKLKQPNCPGPLTLPFIGSVGLYPYVDNNTAWFDLMSKQYGTTWTGGLPGVGTFVAVLDPESVEYILKTNFENYIKGDMFHDRFEEFLGEGIFNVDGKAWKVQRKTSSHMFNAKTLNEHMHPTFVDHAHQVIDFIKAKGDGADIDLQDMFARYTLESISKIAFGTSLGAITSDSLDLATCLRDNNITGSTFGKAFDQAQTAAVWRFLWPFWKLRRMFGTPIERNLSLAVDVVNKYAHDLIKSRREQDLTGKLDVLSWFMNLRDDNGEPYSDEYLRDVIMNFMIAGRDTTANALTWTFHMLTQNPECVTKLREELDSLGIGSPGSAPTAAQLKSMKYTEAVVKETLRLYPSVPRELKMCVKDDTLPDGTSIKAGQIASYQPYCQGRVEKLWGKEAGFPHDAETFYPERWLDEDFKPNAFYYPVFQAGLRTCMGKDMALMEAKTATAMLVASFDIKPVPGHPSNPDIQNSVTCPMAGGLHCVMTPR